MFKKVGEEKSRRRKKSVMKIQALSKAPLLLFSPKLRIGAGGRRQRALAAAFGCGCVCFVFFLSVSLLLREVKSSSFLSLFVFINRV